MQEEWTERFAWYSQGTGIIGFEQQRAAVGVDWELVQTLAGSLFVLVRANGSTPLGTPDLEMLLELSPLARLAGLDADGYGVQVDTDRRSNAVHSKSADDGWITLRARGGERVKKKATPVAYRFPILNLSLDIPPEASIELDGVRLTFAPVEHYFDAVSTLYTRDRYALTAFLTVETPDRLLAASYADRACELASYACGCRIAWLHMEGIDATHNVVSAWLPNAITGPFVPLPLIEESTLWTFMQAQWASYSAFRAENVKQARRLLGLLLNATSSDDFLELRGLKLAGTVDALSSLVLPNELPRIFISNGRRDAFLSDLREHIRGSAENYLIPDPPEDLGRQVRWIAQITEKTNELLRPSFRESLGRVCEILAIPTESLDIPRFIQSRNELVHEARFICQRAKPPDDWPFAEPAHEYYSMLRFVDRLVLRALHYRGVFIDRFARDGSLIPADD